MTRQECTYHSNFELASYKEYNNGLLVRHDTFTPTGNHIYHYLISEYETFWFEYVYEDGKLSWFWNSHGTYTTYNENGQVISMSDIKLKSALFPIINHPV